MGGKFANLGAEFGQSSHKTLLMRGSLRKAGTTREVSSTPRPRTWRRPQRGNVTFLVLFSRSKALYR